METKDAALKMGQKPRWLLGHQLYFKNRKTKVIFPKMFSLLVRFYGQMPFLHDERIKTAAA